MELLRVGIENIIRMRSLTAGCWLLLFGFRRRRGSHRSRFLLILLNAICQLALTRGIINFNARLDIVGKDSVGDPGALVFHGITLHQNAISHQVIPFKDWGHAIKDMVVGLLDVVGDHVLKGQHSLNIQIPCARN